MLKNRFSNMTNFFLISAIVCLSAVVFLGSSAEAATRAQVQKWIVEEAKLTRVPPALALAVAKVESNFRDDALGSQGERGVMQIMPATARGEFGVGSGQLWNGRLNVKLGLRYLERLYMQYGRRWHLALSHYNGGTLKGRGAYAIPHSYNRKYVADVLGWKNTFERRNLVAQIKHTVEVANVSGAARGRPGTSLIDYWMLDDPKTERGWRHYVDLASYWLMPEDERKRLEAQNYADRRYPNNRYRGNEYPVRGDTHLRPSDKWRQGVEKIRKSFRRHMQNHENPVKTVSSGYHGRPDSNSEKSSEGHFQLRPSDIWKRDTENLRKSFRHHLRSYGDHLGSVSSLHLEHPVMSLNESDDGLFPRQS